MRVDTVFDLRPDYDSILSHLTALFGRATSGKIELAWTPADKRAVNQAEYFDVGDIDMAAERAVEINAMPGRNLYVGAALRKPDSPPMGRSEDADFYEAWALHADCDNPDQIESAKQAYRAAGMAPPIVCITGRHPYTRVHLWWPLEEPITDPDEYRAALCGLAAGLDSDSTVVNPSRIMRLAGTVAWAKKEGRIPERTELKAYPEHRQVFDPDEVALSFPPVGRVTSTAVDKAIERKASDILGQGKVDDGREKYMRDTILAVVVEMVGEAGLCEWPTPGELFEAAWPQYRDNVDFSRPGRGSDEFMAKCVSTLRRLSSGRVRGAETVEQCHATYAKKKAEIEANLPSQEDMKAAADSIASGQAEYPLPLIWYDDIEPNLETNDFVEDLLEVSAMSVVYGESNCGKTFWASDLSMHIAAGLKWRDRAVEQGGVIYVALEGGNGIKNRVAAFRKHHKISSMPFAIIPSTINMLDPEADTPKLITTILAVAKQLEAQGLPVRMVVIDTLSRAMAGGNENASEDMGAVVNSADKVRQATGAHLMFIHHSGKNAASGARGHSLLRAATDTEIEVTHDENSSSSIATVTKQREMEGGHKFAFALETVSLGTNKRGKDVRSCVVKASDNDNAQGAKLPSLTSQEYRALTGIKNALASDGYTALVANSHNEMVVKAEIIKREWALLGIVERDKGATQRQQFKRMKDILVNKGYIGFWDDSIWLSVTSVTERDRG